MQDSLGVFLSIFMMSLDLIYDIFEADVDCFLLAIGKLVNVLQRLHTCGTDLLSMINFKFSD
jgi:hypothetical protein